ncbi:HAMP domain-containing protein [Luteimonas sp. BDR2-5]|uniref:ATP-binding protein n=1 Tax=Proluteimonas luteida TaxID=2878685 RepID=UPI001E31AE3F|nr:ATP-binding protein [Luteimonas sp. BDR2-5]MCD9029169.1 HAMP domain-containing protein [Luteimonas sp. BDR2-5]
MSAARARRGLPILARTFLLLLVALLVAHAMGAALFLLRDRNSADVRLADLTALLSSRMPATNPRLQVSDDLSAPPAADAGHRRQAGLEHLLADWLDLPATAVRIYVPVDAIRDPVRGPPPPLPGGPLDDGPMPGWPHDDPGPSAFGDDGPDAGLAPPRGPRPPAHWHPDSPLPAGFIAAARQEDGRWRVVTSPQDDIADMGELLGILVALGLVALLPLAWWFSRALSAPIRRFAEAADAIGRDVHAPPLRLTGPAEIVSASASVNEMQARIVRLLRERTEMVGAIAHDLRTPLARLAFRLQALPAAEREQAEADLDEMSRMIGAALAFLRDQSQAPVRTPLDLQALLAAIVEAAAGTGADVRLAPGPPAPFDGDALALRRMAGNLVDNALRYGGCARLRLLADDHGYRLEIDDDGPGIDPAQDADLFMPFVRGEGSRNRATGGTGLGLASARMAARAHGGDVSLANRDGGGLRATVTLPRGAT